MQTFNTFVSTPDTDLTPAVNCHNQVLGDFVLFPRPREDILAGICWCNPHHSSLRMRMVGRDKIKILIQELPVV